MKESPIPAVLPSASEAQSCLLLRLSGAVQGVGFRPFVYRLASELGLAGYVTNDNRGVTIVVEGTGSRLEEFRERIISEAPPLASPYVVESRVEVPRARVGFTIEASSTSGSPRAVLLPDYATCEACRVEISDPADRRYRYPFTNCTHCGPRFSIIRELPYDRPRTTMAGFRMCADCEREYRDPLDRRFHAQPNACPVCGPTLELVGASGESQARGDAALREAAAAVVAGRVLALKGLGGFHLVVDARNDGAVTTLRGRKQRWEKPLALMVPDLEGARQLCEVSEVEAKWLCRPEAPIVLLRRLPSAAIAASVAPGNPYLGVMLPYTPLHQLLLWELGFPVVATSGNLSDEPICIENGEAIQRLGSIADILLVHDRPIERQVDDSVMMLVGDRPQMIRRSRGFAPLPIQRGAEGPSVLALGALLKNTVALAVGSDVFVSQHIGDLENHEALIAHERVVIDFLRMYGATPAAVAVDLHPDSQGRDLAARARSEPPLRSLEGAELVTVQHHHAHLAACLADNQSIGPALGVIFDGTGFGADGTIWGGEFLLGDARGYERVAHLRPFRLPGGDAAVQEPRRVALALLFELELASNESALSKAFTPEERTALLGMLARGFNAPITTSAGRLFDAVASLTGVRHKVRFEAQAAIELEQLADLGEREPYPMVVRPGPARALWLDWEPLILALLADRARGVPPSIMAARLHEGLARGVFDVVLAVGASRVALSGGCFQNRLLLDRCQRKLGEAGIEVLVHRQVPPNDACIAVGQVAVASAALG